MKTLGTMGQLREMTRTGGQPCERRGNKCGEHEQDNKERHKSCDEQL